MSIILFFISLAVAENQVIFEFSKSKMGVTESYTLYTDGKKEFLRTTSNRFLGERKEFGTYSRERSQSIKKFSEISKSFSATRAPQSIAHSPHSWQIKVMGKPLSMEDVRYNQIFKMIKDTVESKSWKPAAVQSLQVKAPNIKSKFGTAQKFTTKEYNFFKSCTRVFEGRPICEFENGFIFLD